ncbi:hypothetical protein LAZ67_X000478 [Cordylochernes scorpioides]|uniref:RNA-directed DNA polymerase n=1 Tax=Cordylochernes scorpioides TaxID=51811 RepID=A0ABY6LU63_9ARAC|nr:hypothetical protein LAZ67_X000478 [Cordylochernes scorpioides]
MLGSLKKPLKALEKFDGSAVPIKKWLQEIDDNAILFVVAKKLLTGVAKLWLRSQPIFSTWPDLKEAITNEFDNPIDSRNIHILLTKRKKQQFESYYEYFLNMRELGSQGNLEEAVKIQYVIDGIPDQEFNKSILYGSTSYSDFKIKFKNYEMTLNLRLIAPQAKGHLSGECRFKDLRKKCFSCNSFGHIANQCPTRSNDNTLVKQVQTKPHDEKQNYLAETTQKGRMFKDIKINDHKLQALIDTGSQLNLIRIDRYLAIGSPSFDADDRFISGIGNKRVKLLGKFKAEVKIDDVLFVTIFNIVPEDSMKVEVIIGDEMLKEVHFSVVVDYRKLNKETVMDRYPLPLIEDQIDKLQAARLFSTIDLKNEFFHIPVAEDSRKLTSFVQNFRDKPTQYLLKKYQKGIVLTYLDDIVIPANDAEEALKRLKHVLKRAEEYGLQINWEKPSDDKVTAVKRFPELKTIKQLQSFLGLTGYFRKFIKNYSIIAKPLSDMLKTNANFMMGPDQKQAFQDLKQILTSKPVFKIYQVGVRTGLQTDASKFGFGAILLQEDKTNEAQQKYSSYELEVLAVVEAVKKFRIYLLGIKFKMLTDCSAFTMTLKKKDLTTRVARWSLLLEEYDYTIEHRPGSGMKHVDALSRNPVSMMIQTDTLVEKIRNAHGRDSLIKALLVIVKEKQVYDDYFEENNLHWKENTGHTQRNGNGEEMAHEEGHFGIQKNFEMLKKEYYITDLKSKIKKYIQNCISCILSNRNHGKQKGMLHPISKGDTPLDTYHIDHLVPLASTRKDYNYLLFITDGFTKFTWIYPTKTTRTSEVIQKLECQQQIFGNPRRIITDQGKAFTSNDFKEYCSKEESIEHCCITTGVPQGNGQVERINRTIVFLLTELSIDNPQEWHKHVRKLQKALNSTHQRSIRKPPFEILVGLKMRNEEDLQKQEILKIQEENRNTFNKKRKKAFVYKEGDLVVIQKTQFATKSKLYPKYIGPYKVIKIKPNDRYNVEKFSDFEGTNRTSCSADLMKPWFTQDEYPSELSEADQVQDGRM